MLRLGRDDRQQRTVDVCHAGDVVEGQRRLHGRDADARQRCAPGRRTGPGELVDRIDPHGDFVTYRIAHRARPLEIGFERQCTELHLDRRESLFHIRFEFVRKILHA